VDKQKKPQLITSQDF